MWSYTVWCILVLLAIFQNASIATKTYYFNQNKTTSEFLIYNRVNLNKSIQNYRSNPEYLSELRNITIDNNAYIKNNVSVKKLSYPLFDSEWEYEINNVTRSELPAFIHKLYETISKNANNTILYGPTRILFNVMPLNSTIIKFNLTSLNSTNDNITDVDLYFYFSVEKKLMEKPLVLRLYQIEDDKHLNNKSSLINPDSHKLLNAIYIREAESGWQIFKLKSGIQNWMEKGQKNLGLLVTISKPNENQFAIYKDVNSNATRTFAVVKTLDVANVGQPRGKETIFQPNSCRRHSFYIDFKKSNWSHFIIAPEAYSAFTCYGKCYRNDNSLPNHAKMLNAGEITPQSTLCCAPTEYNPLAIMYYDKFNNIAIKVYEDMIVAYCGCR